MSAGGIELSRAFVDAALKVLREHEKVCVFKPGSISAIAAAAGAAGEQVGALMESLVEVKCSPEH